MKLGIVCSVNPSVSLTANNSPCTGEAEAYADQRLPVFRLRVAGGHLCEAEAPTEAAAETLSTELIEGYLFEIKLFTML